MGNKKILIVDDEEEISELLKKKLLSEGHDVLKVNNGEDAFRRIKNFLPDLILMDIVLQDMDGADIVRQLQQDILTADISVIFLSGIVTEGEEGGLSMIKVGNREYAAIAKPFTIDRLLNEIKEIM